MSQRRLLLPPFHGERMQGYGETMAEIAAREIESWPTGTPLPAAPADAGDHAGDHPRDRLRRPRRASAWTPLRAALRDFLDLTTDPRLLAAGAGARARADPPLPAFRRRVDRVDELIHARDRRAPRRRRTSAERDDILSMLVAARHEDGSPMSDAEIRDELLTLLVAGHETTATALAWAVERLVRHPEKLERLRDRGRAPARTPT